MRILYAALFVSMLALSPHARAQLFDEAQGSNYFLGFQRSDEIRIGRLSVADFTGDGRPDIAATVSSSNPDFNRVRLLVNRGQGKFRRMPGVSVGEGPTALAPGDFDGDGDIDLAVVNRESGNLSILANDGTGGFTAAQRVPMDLDLERNGLRKLRAGDFDGDGHTDLALTIALSGLEDGGASANAIVILANQGDGTFAVARVIEPGFGFGGLAVADMDGRGGDDLVVIQHGTSESWQLRVLANDGEGQFTAAAAASFEKPSFRAGRALGAGSQAIAVGELDARPGPDIAIVVRPENATTVGSFPVGPTPAVAVGDYDADGRNDLAFTNQLLVFNNDGDGGLDLAFEQRTNIGEDPQPGTYQTPRGIAFNTGDGYRAEAQARVPGTLPVAANFDGDDADDDLAAISPNPTFGPRGGGGFVSILLASPDGVDDDALGGGGVPLPMTEARACGSWFDPQRSGEGFMLQVSKRPDAGGGRVGPRVLVASWFTYREGEQLWLQGARTFHRGAKTVSVPMIETSGADFGAGFDPTDVQREPWGRLVFHAPDEGRMAVFYRNSDGDETGFLEQRRLVTGCHGTDLDGG